MIQEKKCFGNGLAKGYGCNKMTNVKNRKYGLCMNCYPDWILNSDNGKIKMQKAILKASAPRLQLTSLYDERKERNALKRMILSTKTIVHKYIRNRDKGKPCISCGDNWKDSFQAGHFYASGSFETLKFNFDNINGQCEKCNLYLNGNFENYSLNLPKRIGEERYNALVKLAEIDKQFVKVWTIDKLKEIQKEVKILNKSLQVTK